MGDYFWGAFFILAIVGFSAAGAATIYKVIDGQAECKLNSDCSANNYCGSDLKCHPFPTIENTVVNTDWTTPAAILGLSIILGALILRKRQPRQERRFY